MKLKSEFIKYLLRHLWIIGGFTTIIFLGIILNYIGKWNLGDTISILAVLSSMYIMMWNGHRTDYRFKALINESDKNTFRRIIGPERIKELMIFSEDLEVLYFKSHDKQIALENIVIKLENREDINDDFIEDILRFLKYSLQKITTHNLSSPIKVLIYNEFMEMDKTIKPPAKNLTEEQKEKVIELTTKLYKQVVADLNQNKL